MKHNVIFLFMLEEVADSWELHCFIPDKCLYVKLMLICILRTLLPHSFIFFRFYFLAVYM
jgi:hypothetical protein